MRPAVGVDCPEGMRSPFVEYVHPLQFPILDNLDAIRRQENARTAGRLAACVRLELILPADRADSESPARAATIPSASSCCRAGRGHRRIAVRASVARFCDWLGSPV